MLLFLHHHLYFILRLALAGKERLLTREDLNIFTEGNFMKKKGDSHSPNIHLITMRSSDPPWVMDPSCETKNDVS